jgi:hypothetical protein
MGFSVSNQDVQVLKRICEFFGFGRVRPLRNGVYAYDVIGLDDLGHIASFFERNPLLVKGDDFRLWKRALLMVKEGRHLTPKGMNEMAQMRSLLHAHSVRPRRDASIPIDLHCECGAPMKQGHHH